MVNCATLSYCSLLCSPECRVLAAEYIIRLKAEMDSLKPIKESLFLTYFPHFHWTSLTIYLFMLQYDCAYIQ